MATTEMNCLASGGGISEITQDTPTGDLSTKSYTLTVGQVYLLYVWTDYSTAKSYDIYDGVTATGANITKTGNSVASGSTYGPGTFYKLVPTQANVTLNTATSGRFILFTFS